MAEVRNAVSTTKTHEIVACHYASRQTVRMRWRQDRITDVEVIPEGPSPPWWLAPGLIDIQVNGFAGVDFQSDSTGLEDLVRAVRGLRRGGCTGFLLTLITDQWDALTNRLRRLRGLRAACPELKNAILGWHIEGPFLSSEPGFHGAHDPALMLDPTPDHIHELRALADTEHLVLTLAPERKGALDAIGLAVSMGVKISLGHTNAPAGLLADAIAAGATGFTHLGNACPQCLDRHDNILWRAFETPGLVTSLIPDRIHVSAPLFRLAHRLLPLDSICYTTDAMAAAGAPPGHYTLGASQVEVGEDQVVRRPGETQFAGSALRPIDGVFRAAEMLGVSWQEAWRHFSAIPAEWLGEPCKLAVGQRADFCLIRLSKQDPRPRLRVVAAGEEGTC